MKRSLQTAGIILFCITVAMAGGWINLQIIKATIASECSQ